MLSKVRHYVPKRLRRTIYYSFLNSYVICASEIWGQNQNNLLVRKLIKLQDKVLKLINFQPLNAPAGPPYQENKILKITDFINYKNILFVRISIRKENVHIFNEMLTMLNRNHSYNTRDIPQVRTAHFGEFSLKFKASQIGGDFQINFNSGILPCSYSQLKKAVFKKYLANYG